MTDDPEIERQARHALLCRNAQFMWDVGKNTAEIAAELKVGEPCICRIIWTWRELRRQQKARPPL